MEGSSRANDGVVIQNNREDRDPADSVQFEDTTLIHNVIIHVCDLGRAIGSVEAAPRSYRLVAERYLKSHSIGLRANREQDQPSLTHRSRLCRRYERVAQRDKDDGLSLVTNSDDGATITVSEA